MFGHNNYLNVVNAKKFLQTKKQQLGGQGCSWNVSFCAHAAEKYNGSEAVFGTNKI